MKYGDKSFAMGHGDRSKTADISYLISFLWDENQQAMNRISKPAGVLIYNHFVFTNEDWNDMKHNTTSRYQ